MMFKVFGLVSFVVSLLLNGILLRSSPGLAFVILSCITVLIGSVGVLLLNLTPATIHAWRLVFYRDSTDAQDLVIRMEEIASVIRQDGLLALESKRKDLRDPNLKYLLKKIMDGFEAKDLMPWLLSQKDLKMDGFKLVENCADRFVNQISVFGLLSSLILISGVLSQANRTSDLVGIAQVFTPFLIALGLQMIAESQVGRILSEYRIQLDRYYSALEMGIIGIQSGLNPELLSDRLRSRVGTGHSWAGK